MSDATTKTESKPLPAHGFCHRCGTAYAALTWPRSCGACNSQTYQNPQPVGVAFIPVHDGQKMIGFVGVLRGLADGFGKWAPPGGFAEMRESLEANGVREGGEEAGIFATGAELQLSLPTPHGQILAFSLTDAIHADELRNAKPQEGEILDVGLLARGQPLAFPLHDQAMEALWEKAEARVLKQLADAKAQPAARRSAGPR